MHDERVYHLFPSIDNSSAVNRLNFFGWQVTVGDEVAFGPFHRIEGSHLSSVEPRVVFSVPSPGVSEVRWLGDVLLGCDATGEVLFSAAALDSELVLDLSPAMACRLDALYPVGAAAGVSPASSAPVSGHEFPASSGVSRSASATDSDGPEACLADAGWRVIRGRPHGPGSARLVVVPVDRDLSADTPALDPSHSADLDAALSTAERWLREMPVITGYPGWEEAWRHTWILHRISTFEPLGRLRRRWETPGRGYLFHYFGHWDTVHNVLDMVWADTRHCVSLVRGLLRLQDETDGRLGVTFDPARASLQHPLANAAHAVTSPPLWNYAAVQVFHRTADTGFLAECYRSFRANAAWFETNRRLDGSGLFWHKSLGETGYDNMPRGDYRGVTVMPDFSGYAAVDLSSQMVRYYRDLSFMASALNLPDESSEYAHKATALATAIRELLWDEESGFFYDMDLTSGRLGDVKTIAGFWPMICGAADARRAKRLVSHLLDPDEFWALHPVPSVSLDEPSFCLDCWRGPVWVSQNLWLIYGLQDYGHYDAAASLAAGALHMVADVLKDSGYVYEFYNPFGPEIDALDRKGNPCGPCKYYIGHNPIHAVFFAGLYGMRCTEAGLQVCPQWRWIPRESALRFSFGQSEVTLSTLAGCEGSWRLLADGREIFSGTEGSPATIDYDQLRRRIRQLEAIRG